MTIQQIISNAANETYSPNLLPDRAAELRKELSAIYGNVLDEKQRTELAYNVVLLAELDKQKAATKATIIAKTSKEYQSYLEAVNAEKKLLKMMSSLNNFIKSKEKEYEQSKYM